MRPFHYYWLQIGAVVTNSYFSRNRIKGVILNVLYKMLLVGTLLTIAILCYKIELFLYNYILFVWSVSNDYSMVHCVKRGCWPTWRTLTENYIILSPLGLVDAAPALISDLKKSLEGLIICTKRNTLGTVHYFFLIWLFWRAP